jgi:hypothetical protein
MKMMIKSIVNPYCLDEYSSHSTCPYYRSVFSFCHHSSKSKTSGSFSSCWNSKIMNSFCWNETW